MEAESHALSKRPDADQLFGNAVAGIRVKVIYATDRVRLVDGSGRKQSPFSNLPPMWRRGICWHLHLPSTFPTSVMPE